MDTLDTLKKIENLWFDDADVIFCARKSKFRVHRAILSAQSTIFRDMFTLPQDKKATQKSQDDSFTVITLLDSDEDLYYFFLALFDASFYAPPPSKFPLYVTVSILRLAHKYDVPFLLQRSIVQLDLSFPLDHERLLGVSVFDDDDGYEDLDAYCAHILETLFNLLSIAESTGIRWIVPSVLLTITVRYDIRDIMEEPSFASLDGVSKCWVVQCSINNAVKDAWSNTWLGMLPSENCLSPKACGYMSRKVRADSFKHHSTCPPSYSIDTPLPSGQVFCRGCQAAGAEHQKKVIQKFWNEHPMVCGFASWDEVIQTRDKAMTALNDGLVKFKSIKFVA